MSVSAYAIINAVLAVLVVGAIAGLLLWSLLTQHRDPGCAEVRLNPRRRRRHGAITPLPSATHEAERPAQRVVLG